MHRIEALRDALLGDHGDDAMTELLAAHPAADRQHLRQLVRNAHEERKRNKPPRAFRELFRRTEGPARADADAADAADAGRRAFDADSTTTTPDQPAGAADGQLGNQQRRLVRRPAPDCPSLPQVPTPSSRAMSWPTIATFCMVSGPLPIRVAPFTGAVTLAVLDQVGLGRLNTYLPLVMSTWPPPKLTAYSPSSPRDDLLRLVPAGAHVGIGHARHHQVRERFTPALPVGATPTGARSGRPTCKADQDAVLDQRGALGRVPSSSTFSEPRRPSSVLVDDGRPLVTRPLADAPGRCPWWLKSARGRLSSTRAIRRAPPASPWPARRPPPGSPAPAQRLAGEAFRLIVRRQLVVMSNGRQAGVAGFARPPARRSPARSSAPGGRRQPARRRCAPPARCRRHRSKPITCCTRGSRRAVVDAAQQRDLWGLVGHHPPPGPAQDNWRSCGRSW